VDCDVEVQLYLHYLERSLDDDSPPPQLRSDAPTAALTREQVVAVAYGGQVKVTASDGSRHTLRMPSPSELLRARRRVEARRQAQGLPPGPVMSRAEAVRLTQHL
jgi:hypothetical protein